MTEEIMTLEQLKDYIRKMSEDEILTIWFEKGDDNGRDDADDHISCGKSGSAWKKDNSCIRIGRCRTRRRLWM